ncbi:phosphohistidine phosphatase SixA [Psittacicella gerlachiana]|uniref:Phosphohistidine phosphatase SixA n=1 Tax=Psittacicella gerlachiana TaxID=2028574 RepID=A0A3A1Y6H2_9GAMM|nr:phosphohistidine phosphatase SixA [Psittacicella gerlachiana]RIY31707.1 phosphohistidine phosphatase SixA [Psittacicella gerlachiana]
MLVIVMRHGEAQGFSSLGGDRNRELTYNGVKQAQQAGKILAEQAKIQVKEVLASDYLRAYQTGAEVAKIHQAKFNPFRALSISHEDLDEVAVKLETLAQEYQGNQAVVLVSHIPIVYDLVALVAGTPSSFPFHTGNFVVIDYETKKIIGNSNSY